MKSRPFSISVCVISLLTSSAFADERPDYLSDRPDRPHWHRSHEHRLNDAAKATDIIGMTVKNHHNRYVGKVEDVVVDVESGLIIQVFLSPVAQPGRSVARLTVSPEDLQPDTAENALLLDAYRERRDSSPGTVSPPDEFEKVSQLMGMWVMNRQDERLGNVENILVDLPSGRMVAVIISSRGFRTHDRELSAVPPTALRFNRQWNILQLDISREAFRRGPHFRADQWPDFRESHYAGEVYHAYKVEPYFTIESNSGIVRERDDRRQPPFVQNDSRTDADISAQIRNAIFADRRVSSRLDTVNIVTVNGRVSLYGAVHDGEEKRLIGEIADRFAPIGNADNQLVVSP
jgi:sporulation protein YlmC with PRC-barrel domain